MKDVLNDNPQTPRKRRRRKAETKPQVIQVRVSDVLLKKCQQCASKHDLLISEWARDVLEAHCLLSHIRESKND